MTDLDPLSQLQIEEKISHLVSELTVQTVAHAQASEDAARADVAYKLANARAWVAERGHKGTVPEKEAVILLACEKEYEQMRLTEAVHKAVQEKGRNVRAQLEAMRSINSNIRSAIDHSRGVGG